MIREASSTRGQLSVTVEDTAEDTVEKTVETLGRKKRLRAKGQREHVIFQFSSLFHPRTETYPALSAASTGDATGSALESFPPGHPAGKRVWGLALRSVPENKVTAGRS